MSDRALYYAKIFFVDGRIGEYRWEDMDILCFHPSSRPMQSEYVWVKDGEDILFISWKEIKSCEIRMTPMGD